MKLRTEQAEKHQEGDWWEWSVWIEGSDEDLDQISEVTYKLHPTFPKPLRTVNDRRSKFKLEAEGWGTFHIHIMVVLKGGGKLTLTHNLKLTYPDGSPNED